MGPVLTIIICSLITATVTVGREARRLDSFSPVPVYDVEKAVAFVAERLPEDVSARVSFWDVRKILDFSRDDHDAYGLSSESLVVHGPKRVVDDLVVVSDDRLDRIAQRAVEEDLAVTAIDIDAVLQAELHYLESIGAVGPQATAAI
jgi:hypothetical protein